MLTNETQIEFSSRDAFAVCHLICFIKTCLVAISMCGTTHFMKAPKTKKECQEEMEDFKNDNNYDNI